MKKVWLRLIAVVGLVFGGSELWATERQCMVDYAFSNTCDPYDVKVLSLDTIRYKRHRTSLDAFYKLRYKRRQRYEPFPLSHWLGRYMDKTVPMRLRGTVRMLSDRWKKMKHSLIGSDRNASSLWPKWFTMPWGTYTVKPGDTVSHIASRFHLKRDTIVKLNQLSSGAILRIGQRLYLPLSQEHIDAISSGKYRVKPGDTLQKIAKMFQLDAADIARKNGITQDRMLIAGKTITLPFKHLAKRRFLITPKNKKRSLRVTATAYTSHPGQTDNDPFVAAWNNRLRPGMKAIAVSRDLIAKYGLTNGKKVKISGLPGYYIVKDKMNKRFKRRIDIYMGTDRRRALRWGRRSVIIYF